MALKHIFVPGLTDVHRGQLETVRGAENYAFHGLLDCDRLVWTDDIDFADLLSTARRELGEYDGRIDAIVTHWDFPVSILGPLLAKEHGLPAPSVESLLKCEHKYWSRLEQRAVIPECVPRFDCFDPFDDDALSDIKVEFPFWVKPVKSHSSNLGFEVHDADQFAAAVAAIRDEIGQIGDAFDDVLAMVDLPAELGNAGGYTCLAEQFVTGTQAAVEASMFHGEYQAHGVIDMRKEGEGTSFARLDYPAGSVPEHVQRRMIDVTGRFARHIGFDDGCFNAEFMWDAEHDELWLIEVNTRISQAHSDLFAKVDGVSNHEVAIDIALGHRPRMPHRDGGFAVAGQCMVLRAEDAVVTRVPSAADLERVRQRYPGTVITLQVEVGDRLSDLPRQDSYNYILGKLYIGAEDRDELAKRHRAVAAELPFEFAAPDAAGGKESA